MNHLKTLLISTLPLFTIALHAQGEFSENVIHLGVVVEDLDAALAFYTNVIGMTETGGFKVDEDFAVRSGLTDGPPLDVKVLRLEDSPQATQWKLMSFGKEAAHRTPAHIEDDTGVQYITIMVNDLTPFIERIRKHNVPLLGETPVPLGEDRHFVLVQDPDGTFVELIGPMK